MCFGSSLMGVLREYHTFAFFFFIVYIFDSTSTIYYDHLLFFFLFSPFFLCPPFPLALHRRRGRDPGGAACYLPGWSSSRASPRAAPSLSVAEWEIRVSSRLPAHNQIITKVSPALNTSRLTLPPPSPSDTPTFSTDYYYLARIQSRFASDGSFSTKSSLKDLNNSP